MGNFYVNHTVKTENHDKVVAVLRQNKFTAYVSLVKTGSRSAVPPSRCSVAHRILVQDLVLRPRTIQGEPPDWAMSSYDRLGLHSVF